MLLKYENILKCTICGESLYLDGDSTIDEYSIYMSMNATNFSDKIDDIINDYLVYVCEGCGKTHKYTTKDVERLFRKELTKRALLVLINDLVDPNKIMFERYLIYCNKCQGFDGKGSCPKSIFDKCEIKRFPIDECL